MSRKKPVRHIVHTYKKRDGTVVRQYVKGSGFKSAETLKSRSYLEPKFQSKRWEQIADGPDYQWRSTENPHITVNANKEERDEDELEEEHGEDYDYGESGFMYLVFPSYDNRGIPSSPDIYDEGSSGSFANAKKDAIEVARKIMKLPIEKIETFNWNMV